MIHNVYTITIFFVVVRRVSFDIYSFFFLILGIHETRTDGLIWFHCAEIQEMIFPNIFQTAKPSHPEAQVNGKGFAIANSSLSEDMFNI